MTGISRTPHASRRTRGDGAPPTWHARAPPPPTLAAPHVSPLPLTSNTPVRSAMPPLPLLPLVFGRGCYARGSFFPACHPQRAGQSADLCPTVKPRCPSADGHGHTGAASAPHLACRSCSTRCFQAATRSPPRGGPACLGHGRGAVRRGAFPPYSREPPDAPKRGETIQWRSVAPQTPALPPVRATPGPGGDAMRGSLKVL